MYLRCLLIVLAIGFPRIASGDSVKVAVVPGIAVNLDAARVDALSQDLASALSAELEVEAIGGVEVRRKLPEAGLPPDCVANDACTADVAKRLGADQLLFVVMIDTGTGGAIQVDSTWVDPVARKSASRSAVNIAVLAEARDRFVEAARQLLPDAAVRPKLTQGFGQFSAAVPRHLTLPAYATAAATVAGLGVGVSFGLSARRKYKDCEALPDCAQGRRDSIRTTALIADIGWVVALGGTIATAVLYATSAESAHVIVEPTPGGAAVTAVGRF